MIELTLLRTQNPLAQAKEQRRVLQAESALPHFQLTLQDHGLPPLTASGWDILQINVGKLCNQTCRHCHVDAGPDRRESMSRETAAACIDLLRLARIPVLDITGGAPEMNPNFRWIVEQARALDCRVIDRCNLTILVTPGNEDLPEFLARHQVEVAASLPCYLEENVDRQRGDRVFQRSIEGLRRLNALGYGMPDSELTLTLVYNPVGPSLPPPQAKLEADYRRELRHRYGIEFTRLHTITNMPISRFLDSLLEDDRYEEYMQKLVESFNPETVSGLMCRNMLSVDWLGCLYDCDFNQMLELDLAPGLPRTVFEIDANVLGSLMQRRITTSRHCFGCTAGSGSGCQGAIEH